MIPFRRLWRRVQAPAEPVVSRELAASLGVALAAVERGDIEDSSGLIYKSGKDFLAALDAETAKPKPEPAVHLHYGTWASGETAAACGHRMALSLTEDPAAVTCGACKRTRIFKTRISPAVIPAAGTTRKQES